MKTLTKPDVKPLKFLSKKQLNGIIRNLDNKNGFDQFFSSIWYMRCKILEQLRANPEQKGQQGYDDMQKIFDCFNRIAYDILPGKDGDFLPVSIRTKTKSIN